VAHVLEGEDDVVLGGHVVREVGVHNQTEEAVDESEVNLLVHALELRLDEDNTLAVGGLPDLE